MREFMVHFRETLSEVLSIGISRVYWSQSVVYVQENGFIQYELSQPT